MAQPVWVLSVDLQTKSATFVSGMGDAARGARGAFGEIKSGAREMGAEVSGQMGHARHGVMLLGEEFGIHLPRGLTTFISQLGPVGAAMNAAFPFIAIAVGATLLLEKLEKMKEAGLKLTEDQAHFALAVQNAFNMLDEKLLQAGIRADDLNGNHLGALKKQLELINRQSMDELVKTFDRLAIEADKFFKELESHWYTAGIGADGAKNALDTFKSQYANLLAQGKDKQASDLLAGTRESAQHILAMMEQAKSSKGGSTSDTAADTARYNNYVAAVNELKKAGVGITEKEVQAQQTLVDALNAQVGVEAKIAQLKAAQSGNATHVTADKMGAEADKLMRAQMEEERKVGEEEDKLRSEAQKQAVTALQEGEREKIDATRQGSAARLAAIGAAIQEENNWGLQETGFYRALLLDRVTVTREMSEEMAKQAAEAGKQQAAGELKMGELALAADKEQAALRMSRANQTTQQIVQQKTAEAKADNALRMESLSQEIAALDKSGKDYENKLGAIQMRQAEQIRKHENELTAIKTEAEINRNKQILAAENKLAESVASTAAKSIMHAQNMGQAFARLGDMMLENALKNLLMLETVQGRKRLGDARTAATDAWESAGNPILGAIEAAATFAAVMAFSKGTDRVPGTGHGDTVPAMLTPGEGVVPGGVMDGLGKMARSGNLEGGGGHTYNLHVRPTYNVQTIDGNGMQDALNKHTDVLQRHFENTLRKMNR